MSYAQIVLTNDPLNIRECQFALNDGQIRFTPFDSCIGVVGLVKDAQIVIGIHLVLISEGEQFDQDVIGQIMNILTNNNVDLNTTKIVGQIEGIWDALVAYGELTDTLGIPMGEPANPPGIGNRQIQTEQQGTVTVNCIENNLSITVV